MKLEIVLHCYIVEPERLAVLHDLLHAVTFHKLLIINDLLCYVNDNFVTRDGHCETFRRNTRRIK
jgi:hypothetical protein